MTLEQEEILFLKSYVREVDQKNAMLKKENRMLMNSNTIWSLKYVLLKDDINQLKDKLFTTQQVCDTTYQMYVALNKKKENNMENERMERKLADAYGKIEELNAKIADLEKKVDKRNNLLREVVEDHRAFRAVLVEVVADDNDLYERYNETFAKLKGFAATKRNS